MANKVIFFARLLVGFATVLILVCFHSIETRDVLRKLDVISSEVKALHEDLNVRPGMQNYSTTLKAHSPADFNGVDARDLDSEQYITTYHSSEWEKMWLSSIHLWQKHGVCEALNNQTAYLNRFMQDTCSAHTDTPWCLIDDGVQQLWYHTVDGRVQAGKVWGQSAWPRPPEIRTVSRIRPTSPARSNVWSWFERKNVRTGEVSFEYIEPLVGHLRHPLALCGAYGKEFLVDRSYVLPGVPGTRKAYLFDAGASSWNQGSGGPSLSYFAETWKRYGFDWVHIEAWEGSTAKEDFEKTVPLGWRAKTRYHNQFISTQPSIQPFVPSVIEATAKKEDYVVFKLDIDSKKVETAIVDYMMTWEHLALIDEFLWEQHVDNYLMAPYWTSSQDMSKNIADSYHYFLRLRRRGVRAHSWV